MTKKQIETQLAKAEALIEALGKLRGKDESSPESIHVGLAIRDLKTVTMRLRRAIREKGRKR